MIGECEVLVVRDEHQPVGFLALRDEMVEHLYVRPDAEEPGIGSALIEAAKARRSVDLGCGSCSATEPHGAFYASKAFVDYN